MSKFPFVNSVTFPFGNLPLGVAPYYSRTAEHVVNDQKNYNYIAYKPGYALQASELNEFMDLIQFNQTMTNYMVSNWGGPHVLLNPRNVRTNQTQCIGESLSGGPGGLPGYIGTCPVDPRTVDVLHSSNASSNTWTVRINPGWYYVVDNDYRLGVFTYLAEQKSISFESNWNSSGTEKIGVKLKHTYVSANGDVDLGLGDTSLYDNSGGFIDENAPGADRVKIEIDELKYFGQYAPANQYSCQAEENASTLYGGNPCRCISQMMYVSNNQLDARKTAHFANGVFIRDAGDQNLLGATDDYVTCTQFSPWGCD